MGNRLRRKHKKHIPTKISFGFIIFGVIFIYMLIRVVMSINEEEIATYQVVKSDYDSGFTETGIAIRNETVNYSTSSGYVYYYINDGEKVSKGSNVYSIDGTGAMAEALSDVTYDASIMKSDYFTEIDSQIEIFKSQISADSFYEVYNFKYDLENKIMEAYSEMASEQLSADATLGTSYTAVTSSASGIVAYYQDGFEALTADAVTADAFNEEGYTKTSLKSNDIITSGDAVYKLIDSEEWQIAVMVTEDEYNRLIENDTIKFTINGGSKTIKTSYTTKEQDDSYFVILNMTKYMAEYVDERYLDISFVFSEVSGLQIPNSSITEKTVYKIPIKFIATGDGKKEPYEFNQRTIDENGDISSVLVSPTVYYTDETYCYVDGNDLDANAVFIENNTNDTFSLISAATENLQGVYCTSKGTAIFRRIVIITQGDAYTLVEDGTNYGVSAYDWIVLDAETVEENQSIY